MSNEQKEHAKTEQKEQMSSVQKEQAKTEQKE